MGIQFGHWFGDGAHQWMRDVFVNMEHFVSDSVMVCVHWISAKFGGS